MLYQLLKKVCSYVYEGKVKQKATMNLLLPTTCTVYVSVYLCLSHIPIEGGGKTGREITPSTTEMQLTKTSV